ncbi:DUF1641 domain-containing protein [Sediminibacillus massiliensis]|uniref:DUF1641 domain-containing protein n=1 Tax=Sediminibacillus massiliensis TaxID=1926277 RepID=UPI0009883E3D|nr:DUF1641 domain-containing protein [Sediminibacillus massiliensis]
MAKAIQQIEREESNVEEERSEDLSAILKQIADNREVIEESLSILQELHKSGVLPMIKGLLQTREKVGSIAIEQINQPGMHNIIKNAMSGMALLSAIDPDQLKQFSDGLTHGMQKAAETSSNDKQVGMWGLMKSMRDPNVKTSLNTMMHFLNGLGEGLNSKQTH